MWASYHRQQEAYLRRREEARVEEQQLAVKAMAAHDDTKRVRIGDRWMEGAYHVIGHQRVDAAGDGDSGKATAKTKSTPQKVGPASSTTTSSRTTVLAEDAPEVEELLERLVVLRRYHEKSTLNGVGKQQQSAADAARQHKETLLGEEPHVDTNASIDELFDNTMSLVFRDRIDTGKIEPSMPSFTRPAKMASTSGADTLNDALPAADWQRRSAALDERQRKLRDAEKVLLVERWKKEWEYRRPPRPNWHALAGKDFTLEAEKHRRITRDEAKFQRELREMKDRLLEIRWNVLVQNVKHGRVAVGEVPAQQK